MPVQNKDFALVVGLNDYPFFEDGTGLNGAIHDATEFATWLKDTATGGGLPPQNCKLIVSTGDPLTPDVSHIENDLVAIRKAAEDAGGGRRFYLFFSGHGHSFDSVEEQLPDVALCLPHWSRDLPNKSISANHIRGWVQRCMPFDEIVMFFDCCRSRILKSRAQNTAGGCMVARQSWEDTKIVSFFAAENEQKAFESPEADEIPARGYFSRALLDGLKGAAAATGGEITHSALWSYLQAEVPRLAQLDGRRQVPRLGMQLPKEELVFGGEVIPPHAVGVGIGTSNFEIRFNDWREGTVRLRDADSNILIEDLASTGPWPVTFRYELHLLEDLATGEILKIVFRPALEGKHVTF
ncbi:caspase family protein [Agrobacterium rosae]|uniref:caspase family protein n=1 Tax=Agrobacterium rosae TaxID=1972867 RepID=UPI0020342833|nr:caspase family protein [Agrobacterium rosae]MCM2435829.1 hypothetical protein [Agrobacterium rosae]